MPSLRPGDVRRGAGRTRLRRWAGLVLPPLVVLPAWWAPTSPTDPNHPARWSVVLVLAAVVVVAGRRRYPRSAAGAAIVLALLAITVDGPFVATLTALIIVAYSIGRHTSRRTTLIVVAAAAGLVGTAAALVLRADVGGIRSFVQVVALVGFGAAAGDAARSRHAFVEATNDRLRRAQESHEADARNRVMEERLMIARDLHDVMAHQIAVINLHAGGASQALTSRPEDAERSLATIREASRTVLSEIASLLRVLRAPDLAVTVGRSETAPVSGLAQLDRLVAEFESVGLSVDLRTVGLRVEVPEAVDLVAYRVLQEALTNAQKHGGDSSALLQLDYTPDMLELTVINTVAKAARHDHEGGHGLLGAAERVASVNGRLKTAFGPGPVHRLTAWLPLKQAETGPTTAHGGGT